MSLLAEPNGLSKSTTGCCHPQISAALRQRLRQDGRKDGRLAILFTSTSKTCSEARKVVARREAQESVASAPLSGRLLGGDLLELREGSGTAYVTPVLSPGSDPTMMHCHSRLEFLGCDGDHAAASCLRCHP